MKHFMLAVLGLSILACGSYTDEDQKEKSYVSDILGDKSEIFWLFRVKCGNGIKLGLAQ